MPAKATKFWTQHPLEGERFVKGEKIDLYALFTSYQPVSGAQLKWTSYKDGILGTGSSIVLPTLSSGNHQIKVEGYDLQEQIAIRVFNDLWDLYKAPLSQAEINRTMRDFNFNWIDSPAQGEFWENYGGFEFDQRSGRPAKIVAIAKVDLLRHQYFSEPLPFSGKTLFEHIKQEVRNINLKIDDSNATGGGDTVSLHRSFSTWYITENFTPLQILIHEARHCEHDDPGHTRCNDKDNMDRSFDGAGASSHARAVLYLMWIYKYGLFDPLSSKNQAKVNATSILKNRFCNPPSHSNPKVQVIIDELLQLSGQIIP